jgi:hypothetical protein
MPFRALLLGKIYGGKNLEPIFYTGLVLFLYAGESLHVGLAETQENPEVRVLAKRARVTQEQPEEEC